MPPSALANDDVGPARAGSPQPKHSGQISGGVGGRRAYGAVAVCVLHTRPHSATVPRTAGSRARRAGRRVRVPRGCPHVQSSLGTAVQTSSCALRVPRGAGAAMACRRRRWESVGPRPVSRAVEGPRPPGLDRLGADGSAGASCPAVGMATAPDGRARARPGSCRSGSALRDRGPPRASEATPARPRSTAAATDVHRAPRLARGRLGVLEGTGPSVLRHRAARGGLSRGRACRCRRSR